MRRWSRRTSSRPSTVTQYCYEKYKAYQPLTTYWHEAGLIAHTEFRDGNVPAGYQQKRVLTEALAQLPSGVKKVMVRSDTAGYQQELLRYCAKGQDERLGEIEFAVGVMVTPEFRKALTLAPFHLGHHSPSAVPTPGTIPKVVV